MSHHSLERLQALATRTRARSAPPMRRPPAPAPTSSRELQGRVLAFSGLGLLGLLLVLALFGPSGMSGARQTAEQLLMQTRVTGVASVGWAQAPTLLLAGLAAGILSGMLGMGGGVLKVTCMLLLFDFDIFFSRAISIVTMSFSTAAALGHYIRMRQVVWPVTIPMVLVALPAAVVGILIGNNMGASSLTFAFGVFLMFLALNTLALTFDDPHDRKLEGAFGQQSLAAPGARYRSGAIGALHGLVCGVLGISGGVIATPLQQLLLHVPTRMAIGSTLVVSAVVTGVCSTFVVWTGVSRGDFQLSSLAFVAAIMGGAAIVGARIGTRLGERCNLTFLRLLFVALVFAAGLTILF